MSIIDKIKVGNTTYDISDASTPEFVKNITENDITKWNTVDTKQDALESGVNIKTINNQNLLGEGNVVVTDATVPNVVRDITENDVTKWNKAADVNYDSFLKFKGHVADLSQLPSEGQASGPTNSGFNLDTIFINETLNVVFPERDEVSKAFLKDFNPNLGPSCSHYVAFLQQYDDYYTSCYAECLKTDYPEQLKFISGLSIKSDDWTYKSAVVVLYDENKPVYRRHKDDRWEIVTKNTSYLVVGNQIRLNTQLRTPKDSDGSSGNLTKYGSGYAAVTLSTKNKGYSEITGRRYYYDQDYIIIVPGKENDYGVIYDGASNVVENDVYTVGENNALYRGNAFSGKWEQLT